MTIFKLFTIVCSLAVPPSDCVPEKDNQLTVFSYEMPLSDEERQSDLGCLRRSMLAMAPLAIAPRAGIEYMKATCVRERDHA